jgi:hypothetical protein
MNIKDFKEWLNQFPDSTTILVNDEIFTGVEFEDHSFIDYQLDFSTEKPDIVNQKDPDEYQNFE